MPEQKISSPIVGSRFHAGASEALAMMPEDCTVWLVRQPHNPHDRNAVAIYANRMRRQQLGYVVAAVAKILAPLMDARALDEIEARFLCVKGKPEIAVTLERW